MNTKTQEALKMAIEAMEMHVPYYIKDKGCDALIACKEALEQPSMTYEQGFAHGYEAHRVEQEETWFDEIAQPAQEPVAYKPTSQEQSVMHQAMIRSSKLVHKAHPAPLWQGLSDDEICKLSLYNDVVMAEPFARAIEQALRNKNG